MPKPPPPVNAHTHIFTGDHVPPWLARTIVPWPFYYLLPLSGVVWAFRFWYGKFGPGKWRFYSWWKTLRKAFYAFRIFTHRSKVNALLYYAAGIGLTVHVLVTLMGWLQPVLASRLDKEAPGWARTVSGWWQNDALGPSMTWQHIWDGIRVRLPHIGGLTVGTELLIIATLLLFFPSGRNLLLFLLKQAVTLFVRLPGKQYKELWRRYKTIGRFARYRKQQDIFEALAGQYPPDMRFVILPMDMTYMGAGKTKSSYADQLRELVHLKTKSSFRDRVFPFVFVDPRRMDEDSGFFNWSLKNGKVALEDCLIRTLIEEQGFAGFKIYPALGYYPFDLRLLPLWKYAAERKLPIMTHCIRGIIYYRGPKKKEWDTHPVFRQTMGGDRYDPLLLPQWKGKDFQVNFTHPLNYLCLLDEQLLAQVIAAHPSLWGLFGYDEKSGTVSSGLRDLKICFGHFGGEDEWWRFLEADRAVYARQLFTHPDRGVDFTRDGQGGFSPAKLEQLWRSTDWYTLINSMMLQYPGVYADISYILHDAPAVLPLLKETLRHPKRAERVLYGTDFYVVRNHRSDKDMHAGIRAGLTDAEYDLIARHNPERWLFQ